MKKIDNRRLTISLILLIFLIYICFLVFFNETNFLDLIHIKRTDGLTKIFSLITKFGDWYTFVIITICILILEGKESFKNISINLIGVTILNQLLKFIFQRARPSFNIIEAVGYSFPSGHSMVSMAFYGFLIYKLLKSNHTQTYKIFCTILLTILIIAIGFSRVYLGVHYVTDILAGFVMAIIYLAVFTSIIKKGGKN